MRVPLSWLRDYVDLPDDARPRQIADKLVAAGLEVETVHELGADVSGPLFVGQVRGIEQFVASNGKTIRFCQVDVGEAATRGIVCGALNFQTLDKVVVALPGAVLPGGFKIAARQTYGHTSDGMICSARELGLGDDHTGIMVLPPEAQVGADAGELLGLGEVVLGIAVTPDRGYCLSMRGMAREAAIAYDVEFRDPAATPAPPYDEPAYPVVVEDVEGSDHFVALEVTGFESKAATPLWMQRRLRAGGMRPISLAVDVTNYVMLALGQPLHAYDKARLSGPIVVRAAKSGEQLETLDGVVRNLDADDLLITDDSGPIGIAGVMGGATTEISDRTTDIVIEAAHFAPARIARASRRHKLSSEASKRFERGVDADLQLPAAELAVRLLSELGGATPVKAVTEVDHRVEAHVLQLPVDWVERVIGRPYDEEVVRRRLEQVGCDVSGSTLLTVVPPSWRPDLDQLVDLVEEVARLEGYDTIPSVLPSAHPGRGLTVEQRRRRTVGRSLAEAGFVEVLSYPFVSPSVHDALGLPADDPRRHAVRLANPLSEEEPELRTSLLPGLLATLRRNVGRGFRDVALFEMGSVFRPRQNAPHARPLPVDRAPTPAEVQGLADALPDQPLRIATVASGRRELPGWWGDGRDVSWVDAVDAARAVARATGVELTVRADDHAPWHPGRCAALCVGEALIGHAGELHPRVIGALDLPPRTVAMELELARIPLVGPVQAPDISTFPVAIEDVALIVDASTPAADVEAALRDGAGKLLESLRLFDVYTGGQIAEGKRSLAYNLRFRAPDRTLTAEEVATARQAAVDEAARRTGAVLRSA
jgi:phenylalanyl-tRNA synthetase beta chain